MVSLRLYLTLALSASGEERGEVPSHLSLTLSVNGEGRVR
jgi:hypothetical protein